MPVATTRPPTRRATSSTASSSSGLTVVTTLHQVDYALRYSDRVVALKEGRVAYDGAASGLDRARLIDIYGPEFEDAVHEERR